MMRAVTLERSSKRGVAWRQRREHPRSRVPEDLWYEAVAEARIRGVHATAKAARLGYDELKAWVDNAARAELERARRAFVEVQMPTAPPSVGQARMVVGLTLRTNGRSRSISDISSAAAGTSSEKETGP